VARSLVVKTVQLHDWPYRAYLRHFHNELIRATCENLLNQLSGYQVYNEITCLDEETMTFILFD
jgi:hypothetical protein